MTALSLTAFAAALALLVGPWLVRARWVLRAPGLGVLAWQMLTYTTVVSVGLVGLTSVVHWDSTHELICAAWRICLDALRGAHGGAAQGLAVAGAFLIVGMLGRLLIAGVRLAGAERDQRQRLRTVMRLTGRRLPGLGATVVPSPHPAAYALPGRHAGILVTSGALDRLSPAELRAVMAHERAHARGRHLWLVRSVRLLHRAFPRLTLFAAGQAQVHRLVELCADEVAIRTNQRLTLARALVAMTDPGTVPGPPTAALAADGGDTAERLDRLLQPPTPLPAGVTVALTIALPLLPLIPIVIAVVDRSAHWS